MVKYYLLTFSETASVTEWIVSTLQFNCKKKYDAAAFILQISKREDNKMSNLISMEGLYQNHLTAR